jgi:Patched family
MVRHLCTVLDDATRKSTASQPIQTHPSFLLALAFITITIDFIYQITFFVAILLLDEQRVQANRKDCFVCCKRIEDAGPQSANDIVEAITIESVATGAIVQPAFQPTIADRFMDWYGQQLMRPLVKVIVVVAFTALFGFCTYSATLLTLEFKSSDFLPDQSYAIDFLDAVNMYTHRKMYIGVIFRGTNQSDPLVQQQMIDYIEDLSQLPQVQAKPELCWVLDFQALRKGEIPGLEHYTSLLDMSKNQTAKEQLDLLLSVPEINQVYGSSMVRNEDGDIIASKCFVTVNNVDMDVAKEQIDFLADQRRITVEQPINQGRDDDAFFTFDLIYFIWEYVFGCVGFDRLLSPMHVGLTTPSL